MRLPNLIRSLSLTGSEARDVDEKNSELTMTASTRQVDRYRSIIQPEAYEKHKDRYLANPIILLNHNRKGLVIAKTMNYAIGPDDVQQRVKFSPEKEHQALFRLAAGKYMNGWSVGGQPHSAVGYWSKKERLLSLPEFERKALENGQADYVITEFEHHETSLVTVPANPGALTKAIEDDVISRDIAEVLYQQGLEAMGSSFARQILEATEKELKEASDLGANLAPEQAFAWGILSKLRI